MDLLLISCVVELFIKVVFGGGPKVFQEEFFRSSRTRRSGGPSFLQDEVALLRKPSPRRDSLLPQRVELVRSRILEFDPDPARRAREL